MIAASKLVRMKGRKSSFLTFATVKILPEDCNELIEEFSGVDNLVLKSKIQIK